MSNPTIPASVQATSIPIVLTIAGSDSSGGAGVQADIKAISATGGYACSVITAITAQNTQGVSAIFPIPVEHIINQLDAVFTDLNVVAVKVGMLADADIIKVVTAKIKQYQPRYLVVDPVMVATSGDLLLADSAISTLQSELLPLADLITPNLPESAALTGDAVPDDQQSIKQMVAKLGKLNAQAVLLKGGHLQTDQNSTDLLIIGEQVKRLTSPRFATVNTHGTGCTLSSAIASYLAQGNDLVQATKLAKAYISQAIAEADQLDVGQGHGPVNHFFTGHQDVR